MWRDTSNPSFVFDLSSLVLAELPLPADVLRDYTLEFEIRVEKALMDLREAIRDRDCYWEMANTLMEDIEEMSSAHEGELATLRAKLDRRGLALLGIEAECVQLRSRVAGFKG